MAKMDWEKARRQEQTLRPADGVPVTRARYSGVCILCASEYQVGTRIGKVTAGWAHRNCALNDTNTARSALVTRIPDSAEQQRVTVQQYRKDRKNRSERITNRRLNS